MGVVLTSFAAASTCINTGVPDEGVFETPDLFLNYDASIPILYLDLSR